MKRDLSKLTVVELREKCKKKGIKGSSKMCKEDLVSKLNRHRAMKKRMMTKSTSKKVKKTKKRGMKGGDDIKFELIRDNDNKVDGVKIISGTGENASPFPIVKGQEIFNTNSNNSNKIEYKVIDIKLDADGNFLSLEVLPKNSNISEELNRDDKIWKNILSGSISVRNEIKNSILESNPTENTVPVNKNTVPVNKNTVPVNKNTVNSINKNTGNPGNPRNPVTGNTVNVNNNPGNPGNPRNPVTGNTVNVNNNPGNPRNPVTGNTVNVNNKKVKPSSNGNVNNGN